MSKDKKQTKSKIFDDVTLAYGLVKRINRFHFCFTGDQELVRLGYMIDTNKKVTPYLTAKGKNFLMEVLKPLAETIPEDKPKEDKVKKEKVAELVKSINSRPIRGYFEPDAEEIEDEEDEECENDSQA